MSPKALIKPSNFDAITTFWWREFYGDDGIQAVPSPRAPYP